MEHAVRNLRVHFYGVQGSGSVFPSRAERQAQFELNDVELLSRLLDHLERSADGDGAIRFRVEQLLGKPRSRAAILDLRNRLDPPEPRVYGGWTTCVRVETVDGLDLVLDCGSGFRNCARDLQAKWGERAQRELHLFGTHSHLDHTEGFDQAAVCFDPRNTIRIYGNRQYLRALDQNLGVFTREVSDELLGVQTPIFYGIMPARFVSCEVRDLQTAPPPEGGDPLAGSYHHLGSPLALGATTVTMFEVFHPAPCLAYRIERDGKAFVFCTDHELFHGADEDDPRHRRSREAEQRLRERAVGVDLLYRDGQYFRTEYDGLQGISTGAGVPRAGWGHSCVEDLLEMARECGVRQTLIGHHDPNRDWSERNWVDDSLARFSDQTGLGFALAQAETVVDL